MARAPIHPQKMKMGSIFQQLVWLFLSFFLCLHYNQVVPVWLFMIGQLLIAQPMVAIVLGKAAIFHHGLE